MEDDSIITPRCYKIIFWRCGGGGGGGTAGLCSNINLFLVGSEILETSAASWKSSPHPGPESPRREIECSVICSSGATSHQQTTLAGPK